MSESESESESEDRSGAGAEGGAATPLVPILPAGSGAILVPTSGRSPTQRLVSLDAYRGLVMFLMMAEVLHLARVAAKLPESTFWAFLAFHQEHVEWVGCSLHDLIQPSFTFLVGVALPFSIASRAARGQSILGMSVHAFWRALILVCLGIFLRSLGREQTNFVFEDTLSQIGLGYGVLFLLGFRPTRDVAIALVLILVGYWATFAFYPLPGPDFDWAAAGAAKDWSENLGGFAAHWNKNTNAAWAFDTWFLNLFPRPENEPFLHNGGGYSTLSFVPTLGTMILGLLAGRILRNDRGRGGKLLWLLVAGLASLALGEVLGRLGICPVVKRIWTPSWVLWSGGCCFLLLAAFHAVIDVCRFRFWSFPLVVIGMNSIAAYCMAWLISGFVGEALRRHLSEGVFLAFGPPYETLVEGALRLLVLWLILFWMYRRKVFLRI